MGQGRIVIGQCLPARGGCPGESRHQMAELAVSQIQARIIQNQGIRARADASVIRRKIKAVQCCHSGGEMPAGGFAHEGKAVRIQFQFGSVAS